MLMTICICYCLRVVTQRQERCVRAMSAYTGGVVESGAIQHRILGSHLLVLSWTCLL